MGTNPTLNVNKKNLPTFPYDGGNHKPAVLVGAVVDLTTGEVTGYLPLKIRDNNDGTATLLVKTEV